MSEPCSKLLVVGPPDRQATAEAAIARSGERFKLTRWTRKTPPTAPTTADHDAILVLGEDSHGLIPENAPVPVILAAVPNCQGAPDAPSDTVHNVTLDDQLGPSLRAFLRPPTAEAVLTPLAQSVLSMVTDPLVLVVRDRIVATNDGFAELVGERAQALAGRPVDALFPSAIANQLATTDATRWDEAAVTIQARGSLVLPPQDVSASVVELTVGEATWLLRLKPSASGMKPPRRKGASPLEDATALDELTARVHAAGGRVGGIQIRLIGLGAARALLGEHWGKFARQIQRVCEGTIDHDLEPGDVFVRTASGDYIVCFACDNEVEADRRAQRLQARIEKRLLGDEGRSIVGKEPGRSLEALQRLRLDVQSTLLPVGALPRSNELDGLMEPHLADRRRQRLAEFNEGLRRLATSGAVEFVPVRTIDGDATSILRARWAPENLERLELLAERADREEELQLALDLRSVALVDDADQMRERRRPPVVVDIHLSTLERRKSWDAFRAVAQNLDVPSRKWLIPNVVAIPDDVYPGRLRDALKKLKPFARKEALTVSPKLLGALDIASLPTSMIVITARHARADAALENAERLQERLAKAGASLAIDGNGGVLAARYGAKLIIDDT